MFKKCGFLTITGFPNSGKSTFINNVINKKISIISSKVQTTKDEIKGILNFNKNQFIFLDTPGIINNRKFYNKDMSRAIFNSIDRVSCNLFIYDPMKTILLKDSEEKGLKTINGLRMNLIQAVLAYSYTNPTSLAKEEIYKIMS